MKRKNSLLIFLFVAFAVGVSCKKDDLIKTDSPPQFFGLDTVFLSKGEPNIDPGARAIDDQDGDLSQLISSDWAQKVKTSSVGIYTVNYQVTDLDDNTTFEKRIVSVEYRAGFPTGTYQLDLGKRILVSFLDTVSTTCTISATSKSDEFTVNYEQFNTPKNFKLVPTTNSLDKVTAAVEVCGGPVQISQNGELITFKLFGSGRSTSGASYSEVVVGVMKKLP